MTHQPTGNLEGAMLADRRIPEGDDWLPQDELNSLTPEEMVRRARALQSLLAQHSREAEVLRRPVDEVWTELRKAGFFYHFVPKKYGGLEFDSETFFDITVELAEGCTSTAWVTAFCMEHNFMFAQLPEQAQDEIFGAFPYVIAPGVASPAPVAKEVDGGYILNGRWKFASGVMHADWILVGGFVADQMPPQLLTFALPAEEVIVHDTWHVDGMAGTGSNDIEIQNKFVPAHRAVSLAALGEGTGHGARLYDNPLYRMPFVFIVSAAAGCALGAARGAVKNFKDYLSKRMMIDTGEKQQEKPASQIRLGHADMLVRGAEFLIRDSVRRDTDAIMRGEQMDLADRVVSRGQMAQAVRMCADAVNMVCEAAGASAHQLDNPLQRARRDVNTIANHVALDMDTVMEQHGRGMLGMASTLKFL